MTSGHFFLRRLVATLLFVLVLPLVAEAAKFKVGDVVQVYDDWHKQWNDGTVIQTERRQVLVEYETRGRLTRKVFPDSAVRFAYEADAIAPSRQWVDATGTFKITAALLSIQDNILKLRREDMSEVEVPVDKLGDADQRFIERLRRELGGTVGGVARHPELEQFEELADDGGFAIPFAAQDARVSLLPDPIPPYLRLREGGVAFPKPDFWDELSLVLPVGGPDSWLLAAVSNSGFGKAELPTRLIWAAITNKKVSKVQMLPMAERVLDYHPPTRRLLTVNQLGSDSKRFALSLWEVVPTGDAAKPLVRWESTSPKNEQPRAWGRIVDGRIVLHRRGKQEYVAWDVEAKTMAYKVNQESFFAPEPVLSGGNKYVFLPEDKQVRIFDSQTGSVITVLPAENGSSAVAVSEDGTRAAVLDRNSLTVWNLADAEVKPTRYQAEAIGTPFTAELAWVGSDRVMVNTDWEMVLYSLEHRMALWTYKFDHSAESERDGQRVKTVVNNHLVFGATLREGTNTGFAVGNVELPGPKVETEVAAIDREALELITPGTKVRLEVRCGDDSPQVYNDLLTEIKENGWVLAKDDATAVMYADMTRGERQSVTYVEVERFTRKIIREETVSFTPYISSLKLVKDDQIVYQSGTQTGAPSRVTLFEGHSIQAEVDKWQKPNPKFFGRLEIPDTLIDPKFKKGLGTTDVTTKGLIPR